jgi:hypothetical protein
MPDGFFEHDMTTLVAVIARFPKDDLSVIVAHCGVSVLEQQTIYHAHHCFRKWLKSAIQNGEPAYFQHSFGRSIGPLVHLVQ